jgi:hypothetical protein
MKLSKRTIDNLVHIGNGTNRQIIWDDQLPGFGCRVYPSGKKSFVLSYRIQGRKKLLTLGQYGTLTVDQARKQVLKHTASILDGHDPLAKRQQTRLGETVAVLCSAYLEQHAKRRKRTWREDERRINQHILPTVGKFKVKSVKRLDISNLHAKLGAANFVFRATTSRQARRAAHDDRRGKDEVVALGTVSNTSLAEASCPVCFLL